MSTIHACFQFSSEVTDSRLRQMLDTSSYWRPDHQSWVFSEDRQCGLAKASLWQTALSRLDQAYLDTQANLMICSNARVDNRDVLGHLLGIDEATLRSLPDNQLILRAYQKWNSDCPKYILGDFAFIIWDQAREELYAARDHFGTKLLLFSVTDQGVMLSNEPKVFLDTEWVTPVVKESWLVESLSNNLRGPTAPIYHNLDLLPAAHWMRAGRQGLTVQRYWHLADDNRYLDQRPEDLFDLLRSRFSQAVQRRLSTDYPLSCELSEGLDSNGIAGFAAELEPERTIHTLSYSCIALNDQTRPIWGKTYQDIFEMLEMHKNLRPIWTDDEDNRMHAIKRLYQNTGGVFSLPGAWLWHCELASHQQSRVMLSGWGGDHCVSSYGDFLDSELLTGLKLRKLDKLIRAKYRRGRGAPPWKAWVGLLMKHLTPNYYYERTKRRGGLEHALWERQKLCFVKPEWLSRYQIVDKLDAFTRGYQRKTVKEHHRRELFEIGVESRLIDCELSARQHRLEYRYPMLDVELVELAYNLPSELKSYQGIERYPFRRVLEGVTTRKIQWRVKSDVNLPNVEFLRALTQDENETIVDVLDSSLIRPYVNRPDLDQSAGESAFFLRQLLTLAPHYQYLIQRNAEVTQA